MRLRFWRLLHDTFEWLWHWSWHHMEPLLPKYSSAPIIYTRIYDDDKVTIYRTNGAPMP